MRAYYEESDGSCVLVGDEGQRWLSEPIKGSLFPCRGRARATAQLAPEDLVGVLRAPSGGWHFVGASGTTYEAADPLGAFTRSTGSPTRFEHIAAGAGVLLATTSNGRLYRWEDPTGFRDAGVEARIFDVAVAGSGQALALAFPEALYASVDHGHTFTKLPRPAMGARRLGHVASGALGVVGALGNASLSEDGSTLTATSEAVQLERSDALLVGRFANARAIRSGRAVLHGDRYHELSRGEDAEEIDVDWSLSRGRMASPLETFPLNETAQCRSMHLGASDRTLFVACVRQEGERIRVDLRRSVDDGAHFDADLALDAEQTDSIAMAVSPKGTLLMTGVCVHREGKPCAPTGPVRVTMAEGALRARLADSPEIDESGVAPAFSPDGASAYFLGHRGKDQRLSLFVSHDAGQSFSERSLSLSARPSREAQDVNGEESEWDGDDSQEVVPAGSLAMTVGDDGAVGIILSHGDSGPSAKVYLTTDEDGRSVNISAPPIGGTLGGFGRKALALSLRESEPVAWESLNGGAAWAPIAATPALTSVDEEEPIACSAAGCLIGPALARVGWGAQVESFAPRSSLPEPGETSRTSFAVPMECELSAVEPWTTVGYPAVRRADDTTFGEPGLDELGRGHSLWAVALLDPRTGSLRVASATSDGRTVRVRTDPMLTGRPGEIALSPQIEGYAATRLGGVAVGARIQNLEIAWVDLMAGRAGHAVIRDAGLMEVADRQAAREASVSFQPRLLSVSVGGVFVRPHRESPQTFFLDVQGKAREFSYPVWPAPVGLGITEDAAMIDGRFLAVGLPAHDPAAVVLLPVADRTLHAFALGPADVSRYRKSVVRWTSAGPGALGRSILHSDPDRGEAWGQFQAFQADGTLGPPVSIPTPLDLPVPPRPCSPADASTPRVVAPQSVRGGSPLFLGARHVIEVSERKGPRPASAAATIEGPLTLVISGTVLYGTPTAPCVAAWKAQRVGGSGYAAVLSGDLRHSYLFRPQNADAAGATALEYRTMTCAFTEPTTSNASSDRARPANEAPIEGY